MFTLTHSPFLKALGWSLLNSLWQFGLLWLIFVSILHTRKQISPAVKHGLALAMMSAGFLWFAAGLSFQYLTYSDSPGFSSAATDFTGYALYPLIYRSVKNFLENNLYVFSTIYLLVVAGFFVRFIRFFFYSHTIQTHGLSKMKPELRLYVQKLVQQLDISRRVQVWVSEHVDTPMVMGFLKPMVLIPLACINQLSPKQLEAIILHELAHIRRNDYLVNLYIATIEILFFFNPFSRLLVRTIQQEREKSCDDWVLQFRFDPHQYASALLSLEQSRAATYTLALGATGKNKSLLLQRVQRIMGLKSTNSESGIRMLGYFLSIALLSFIALVNPGNLVLENLEKSFAHTPITKVISNFEYSPATITTKATRDPAKVATVKTVAKIVDEEIASKPDNETTDDNEILTPVSLNLNYDNSIPTAALLQTTVDENKDFSIKDKEPELPPVATVDVETTYPYVPNSSYSFYVTEDSNLVKLKAKKEKDQSATQSMVQTRKAIDKLDWNKIAKEQKLSKTAIIKLQNEIKKSLTTLNWSEIYKESVDSLSKINVQNMRLTLKQEYEKLNGYKTIQQQFETIKTQIQQQQDKYKQEAEIELKAIDKEVKKRKVIVYL